MRQKKSTPEQGVDVTTAPYDVKDQNVVIFHAIDNDKLAHGETAQSWAQILVTAASGMGIGSEKKKICP